MVFYFVFWLYVHVHVCDTHTNTRTHRGLIYTYILRDRKLFVLTKDRLILLRWYKLINSATENATVY